ncbi:hypothetical protein [Nocardioides dilutus]
MTSTQLSMRWLPVADASGRTRLEAVWATQATPATEAPAAPTQAA